MTAEQEERRCPRCDEKKPTWHFARWASSRDHWCRACKEAAPAAWKVQSDRRSRVLAKYRLYPEDVDALRRAQHHKCACCGIGGRRLVIDHCHDTRRVRGLLCGRCNSSTMGDDVAFMVMKMAYLQRPFPDVPRRDAVAVQRDTLHPLYERYMTIRQRCAVQGFTPAEWIYFEGFEIWSLQHGWTEGQVLMRRDYTGPFTPDNCYWTSPGVFSKRPHAEKVIRAWGEEKVYSEWVLDTRVHVTLEERMLFLSRMHKGWSSERALSTTPEEGRAMAQFSSVAYGAFDEAKTLHEWAQDERCVVSLEVLRGRVQGGGWSVERALTTSIEAAAKAQGYFVTEGRRGRVRMMTCFGETKSMAEWARDPRCAVSYNLLNQRVSAKGWPDERAITTPPIRRKVNPAPAADEEVADTLPA